MGTLYSSGLLTRTQAETAFLFLSSGDALFFFNTDDENDPWKIDDNGARSLADSQRVYKYTVDAGTFSGAGPLDTAYQALSVITVPAGEKLISIHAVLNTPWIVSPGSSAIMILQLGPSFIQVFSADMFSSGDIDGLSAGYKGLDVYPDSSLLGWPSSPAIMSSSSSNDFAVVLDVSAGGGSFGTTTHGDLDIWVVTQKLS